jgi:uncharacterized protein YyaL (SSP411 family)
MERESFESPRIAELLNRHFVPIKVDREERPDLDEIYMNAVQLMTGAGGWPLSVFLTPELKPFMGGTYFPPDNRYGRIGFGELLGRIIEIWNSRRSEVETSATRMTEQLQQIARGVVEDQAQASIGDEHATRAAADLVGRFDPRWGGFGAAPKFPPDGSLALLLREHARSGDRVPLDVACRTLDAMALGGMYDQLGGGFARYSVDERWLVPHFEKMLYNQALLVPVYVDAWLLTGRPLYRRVVEQTLDFVGREMRAADGGFYSSLDADSEGREGAFYVWSRGEILRVLGDVDGARFCEAYGVTEEGNFEGLNILNLIDAPTPADAAERASAEEALAALAPLRRRLLVERERRSRPATDDKILTAWNGLMLTAYARAHRALGRESDLIAARDAAEFVLRNLVRGDRLFVSYRDGRAGLNGYLDDYAFLARGLLDLYEAGFDRRHLDACASIARSLVRHFEDAEAGGFLFVSDDHESLLTRNRSLHDGALPSGAGVAAELLLRLGVQLDDDGLKQAARRALTASEPHVRRFPAGHAALLTGSYLAAAPLAEVAVIGDAGAPETRALLEAVNRSYRPSLVLAVAAPGDDVAALPLLRGKTTIDGGPAAHVCRDYACRRPTGDPVELVRMLEQTP